MSPRTYIIAAVAVIVALIITATFASYLRRTLS